jgi:hypothetical protein
MAHDYNNLLQVINGNLKLWPAGPRCAPANQPSNC